MAGISKSDTINYANMRRIRKKNKNDDRDPKNNQKSTEIDRENYVKRVLADNSGILY